MGKGVEIVLSELILLVSTRLNNIHVHSLNPYHKILKISGDQESSFLSNKVGKGGKTGVSYGGVLGERKQKSDENNPLCLEFINPKSSKIEFSTETISLMIHSSIRVIPELIAGTAFLANFFYIRKGGSHAN